MTSMLRQTFLQIFSISLLKSVKKHRYNTRLSTEECFSVKFSITEKMKKSVDRVVVSISINLIFVKDIK